MSKQLAKEVLAYLLDKKMAFCFVDGIVVSREMCEEIIE